MPMLPVVLSSDSHVFEPPDLWQTRIDRAFRDRAPRIERIDGGDHVVVEADQILSGIGLISNAGGRFAAPETISAQVKGFGCRPMVTYPRALRAGVRKPPRKEPAGGRVSGCRLWGFDGAAAWVGDALAGVVGIGLTI